MNNITVYFLFARPTFLIIFSAIYLSKIVIDILMLSMNYKVEVNSKTIASGI